MRSDSHDQLSSARSITLIANSKLIPNTTNRGVRDDPNQLCSAAYESMDSEESAPSDGADNEGRDAAEETGHGL